MNDAPPAMTPLSLSPAQFSGLYAAALAALAIHDVSKRPLVVSMIVLEYSYGLKPVGRLVATIPRLDLFVDRTGLRRSHVSETVDWLHRAEIVYSNTDIGLYQFRPDFRGWNKNYVALRASVRRAAMADALLQQLGRETQLQLLVPEPTLADAMSHESVTAALSAMEITGAEVLHQLFTTPVPVLGTQAGTRSGTQAGTLPPPMYPPEKTRNPEPRTRLLRSTGTRVGVPDSGTVSDNVRRCLALCGVSRKNGTNNIGLWRAIDAESPGVLFEALGDLKLALDNHSVRDDATAYLINRVRIIRKQRKEQPA